MLAKLRCVKKTYMRKGFYSQGEAWPTDQVDGRAANNFPILAGLWTEASGGVEEVGGTSFFHILSAKDNVE
jgi:hypothetical protein